MDLKHKLVDLGTMDTSFIDRFKMVQVGEPKIFSVIASGLHRGEGSRFFERETPYQKAEELAPSEAEALRLRLISEKHLEHVSACGESPGKDQYNQQYQSVYFCLGRH